MGTGFVKIGALYEKFQALLFTTLIATYVKKNIFYTNIQKIENLKQVNLTVGGIRFAEITVRRIPRDFEFGTNLNRQ